MTAPRPRVLLAVLALLPIAPADAAPEPAPGDRSSVVDRVAKTIETKYHDPKRASDIAQALRKASRSGRFRGLRRPEEWAAGVSKFLAGFDRHFNVRFAPVPPGTKEVEAGHRDRESYLAAARRSNFGFEKVERRTGNVGYLRLRSFEDASLAGGAAAAAMTFLENTDALIIDLRRNGGGDPGMVQLLASYFFEDNQTHLNNLYWRPRNFTRQLWTLSYVPGKRRPKVPLFILTSRATGSAAEAFAYHLQALERATVIGTKTAGAANPGDMFRVGDFALFISTGRAINPVTETNWEGTGVTPDVAIAADAALEEALRLAWTQLLAAPPSPDAERELTWALEELAVKRTPIALEGAAASTYVGVFGVNTITLADGVLYFQRRARAPVEMIPVGRDRFMPRGQSDFRLVFDRSEKGKSVRLRAQWGDGFEETSAREE